MKGFFSKREVLPTKKVELGTRRRVQISLNPCGDCGLFNQVRSPRMSVSGKGRKNILIYGEAPGGTEDKIGVQFIGEAGKLLEDKLKKYGLDLHVDFYLLNAVNCRPTDRRGSNRTPTTKEVKCCYSHVQSELKKINPDMIWLVGNIALESYYFGKGFSNLSVSSWRRRLIHDQENKVQILCLYHPSAVLRNPGLEHVFDGDLKWAVSCIGRKFKKGDHEGKVKVLTDFDEIISFLDLIKEGTIDFDYETNTLDPRREGSKILSISVQTENDCFAFPFEYKDYWKGNDDLKLKWINILADPNIKLSGHNIKFEERWNRKHLKTKGTNWVWDSMLGAHLLAQGGERIAGLKIQVYMQFGTPRYDKELQSYMRIKDVYYNNLEECDLTKLLYYNGLDSYFSRLLRLYQQKLLNRYDWFKKIAELFMKGCIIYMDVEDYGVPIDLNYYNKEKKNLIVQLQKLYESLSSQEELKQFKELTGRDFRLGIKNGKISISANDLRTLLYDVLKIPITKRTMIAEEPSVDEEVLSGIDNEFVNEVLSFRKKSKIVDTYFSQFIREEVKGKVNPTVNQHIARTGRPSCSNPNLYNIPKRDEEAMKLVRRGIVPSTGNQLWEGDYKGIEVCIAACYTQDPVLIDYINDSSKDMHRDMAAELFVLDLDEVTSKLRYIGKNSWVFPQFYGSWCGQCGDNIWREIEDLKLENGMSVFNHLHDQGLKTQKKFIEHCRSVEIGFWKRFSAFKSWQLDTLRFYERHGYVESLTGFRREGFLTKNMVLNSNIQGTAYHCLLWSLIKLGREQEKRKWKSRNILQIYDAMLYDLDPEEKEEVKKTMIKVMTEDIREYWSWLVVPLQVSFEISEIDGSWASMKGIE